MKTSRKLNLLIGPLVMLAIVVAGIFMICGQRAILVVFDSITYITMLLIWCLAGAAIGRVAFRDGESFYSRITRICIGIGILGLLFHLLGLGGFLNRTTILVPIAIGAFFEATQLIRHYKKMVATTPSTSWHGWILLAVPLLLAIVCASIAPGFLWKPLDPHPYDVMSYHLQVPREWYDAGKIIPLEHNAFSYFPMLMETHYLAAMHLLGGPWKGMYLCQFISLAHSSMLVCGVAGLLLELGASRFSAWSAGLMTATIPWVFMLSTVCYVEPGVMLYGTLGIGWLILTIKQNKALAPAGICLGLACGFKYTAFAMTLLPAVVALLLLGLIKRNRHWMMGSITVFLTAAICFSPWLVRNIAWTGNPVFPLMTGIFGKAHFTDDQVDRYQAAHRPPADESGLNELIKNGWNRTVDDPQFGNYLIPVSAIALLISIRRFDPAIILIAMFLFITTVVWLFGTHVMPRFLSPIIPVLVILIYLSISTFNFKHAKLIFPAFCLIQAVIGMKWLWTQVEPTIAIGREGLFLLTDYSPMEDPAITRARAMNQTVDLIGDAQAFFYVLPSKQLRYRSVFDVNILPGQSTANGWLGMPVDQLRQRGDCVIIREDEIERLSHTYRHLSRQ